MQAEVPDDQKLIFGQTIESLLKAFGPFSSDELSVLDALKINPQAGSIGAAYPLSTHLALMELIAKSRFPGVPEMEAYTAIGTTFIAAYEKTLTGRALMAAMRMMGPKRVMGRLTKSLQTGNNYSIATVTELGPTEVEIWFNYVTRPGFYKGLLLGGLGVAGAKNLAVDYLRQEGKAALFRLKWDP